MKTLHFKHLFVLLSFTLFLVACSDDEPQTDPCNLDFNQEGMFTNLADNLIIPAYNQLKTDVDALVSTHNDFQANPNATTLNALRNAFQTAYISWQHAAPYKFGPSEEVFLYNSINNFPLDVTALESKLQNENYDFSSPDAYDKGLPAIDYLLFGIGNSETAILEKYTTDADATKYKTYLMKVVEDIQTRVNSTHTEWTQGNYRTTFIANTGTAAGTSLGLIVNGFNENYEFIKREKLGVPSGVVTLGFTNPNRVEAFYSGISVALAKAALQASIDFYTGKTGLGLDDYLIESGAMKNGGTLDEAIKNQFTAALTAVEALEGQPLSQTIEDNNDLVIEAYNEVTKQLVNIKTDLPSVLCVAITYIDNPSDSD